MAMMQMQPVNNAGGLNISAQQGILQGGMGVGANFPVTIKVVPKLEEGAELKVWGTASGLYGLPSECGLKVSPSATTEDVYAALQAFANAECGKAGEGLTGQSQMQGMGLNMGALGISVKWTPTIQALSFEGDEIPRSPSQTVGSYLKHGEEFQAKGILAQDVATAQQGALGAMMDPNGAALQQQLDMMQGGHGARGGKQGCCSVQ